MTGRTSLFKFSGLPDSFGVILLVVSLVLLLAPYLSGADFGVFKVPAFADPVKRWLRIIGPILFLACIFLFIPIIPLSTSKPDLPDGPRPPEPHKQSDPEPGLTVVFDVSTFTGADVLIGNEGTGIFLIRDLTINWDYSKCPKFEEPSPGAPLVEYRYTADLTTSKGSKLLDPKTFKYGSGEVDNFHVDLKYPDYGVYTVWISFKHKRLGKETEQVYKTASAETWFCVKF